VDQGASPVVDEEDEGCCWLHVVVLLGAATGVSVVAVADFTEGNEPTEEMKAATPTMKISQAELTTMLVGADKDGVGAAKVLRATLTFRPSPPTRPHRSNVH